jgi:hypothetical protein
MSTITVNDWNNVRDGSQSQVGIKVQEQINRVRRQFADQSLAGFVGTQSDFDVPSVYTDVSSAPGISSLKKIAMAGDDIDAVLLEKLTNVLDSRAWLVSDDNLSIDIPESTPSSTQTSISDWIAYIRNNMDSLKESEQLANRITFLANETILEEGRPINEESLATFVMFLSSNRITSKPSTGITADGYIDALWRHSKDSLIEVIFRPGDESQIVTFSPDLTNAMSINKRVATLPIKTIMDVIRSRKLDYLLYGSNEVIFAQAV